MSDLLPTIGNGVGVASITVLLWWMLATGRLVTRREHEGRIADKQSQIEDWREVAKISARHTDELAETARVQLEILASQKRNSEQLAAYLAERRLGP